MANIAMQRMHNLDYMRGIAMVLVIVGHVIGFSFKIESSEVIKALAIFHMPVFFIVSGYLSFKLIGAIDARKECIKLVKRTAMLLIPLWVWSFLRNLAWDTITPSLTIFYGGGYWFFYCLWLCTVIGCVSDLISRSLKLRMVGDIILFLVFWLPLCIANIMDVEIDYFPISSLSQYYVFYAAGYLLHKYKQLYRLAFSSYTYLTGIVLFVCAWCFSPENKYLGILLGYLGAFGAIAVLWKFCEGIEINTLSGKILDLIGRNTLPIYAIHYLFISSSPAWVRDWAGLGFAPQLALALGYTAVIIFFSLIVDRIISYNKYSRFLFFGEIKKRNLWFQ